MVGCILWPMSKDTKPHVFIVESNQWKDEQDKRTEGAALAEILSLANKKTEYRYIRTIQEFKCVLKQFVDSRFRYLHLACHGTGSGLAFTLDTLPFEDLADILMPYLHERRLFISACQAVNRHLAEPLLTKSKCFSVIGPKTDIYFSDAAVIWSAFYVLRFKHNNDTMKAEGIETDLHSICSVFDVRFNAYFRRSEKPKGYRFVALGNASPP
jgi:hypothetical protein